MMKETLCTRSGARFGPAGNGDAYAALKFKRTADSFAYLASVGATAYEYQCGNGVVGSDASFAQIGACARAEGISLSLHAPYFISLSGVDPEKRLKSVDYVSASLHAARAMGADLIVIHAGSAGKISRTEAMALAKDTLAHILSETDHEGILLGIETMGKVNQLGTLEEVLSLCEVGKGLCPVVDFGHLNAREAGGVFQTAADYARVFDRIGERLGDSYARYLHCHVSKIAYTAAGEKKHLTFEDREFGPDPMPLIDLIAARGLCPRIICESAGTQLEDALAMAARYAQEREKQGK